VGEPTERSCSPAPTVTEVEPPAPVAGSRTEPPAAPAAEEPVTTEAEEEAPAEAGLVDIASILGVGDSPGGPLKQPGKPHLKPAKAKAKHVSLKHTGHAPRHGGPDGPPRRPTQRSLRAGSASLEGTHLPRVGSAPFEGVRLPRAGSASLEGPRRPQAGSASLEGAPHAHAHSRTRVRAFNALTTAGWRHHALGTHAPVLLHRLPRREPIPATVGDCATWPVPAP
jgi:hypothetical protein